MQIILFGAAGIGKTSIVGEVLAREHGLPHVPAWDGVSKLPPQCVAETNNARHRSPSGAIIVNMHRA